MAELRIAAQLPDTEKINQSDYVILNNSSFQDLEQRASEVWRELKRP
jgi:dephospho-CoA kinase